MGYGRSFRSGAPEELNRGIASGRLGRGLHCTWTTNPFPVGSVKELVGLQTNLDLDTVTQLITS